VLSIVEAAYAIDAPSEVWASNLLQTAERAVGGGMGGFTCEFALQKHVAVHFDPASVISAGVPDEMLATIFSGLASSPPEWLLTHLRRQGPPVCVLTSEADAHLKLGYRRELAARGVHDGVNIVAIDLNNQGFLLSLGVPRSFRMDSGTRRGLTSAATHILAAIRLRTRLGLGRRGSPSRPVAEQSPEAVLSAEGSLLHAQGEATLATARRALHRAAQQVEYARRSMRDQPAQAVDRWKGLVAARWTILDHFDEGGNRYIVAQENRPRATGPDALTETERTVVSYVARGFSTKEAAYALGVSDTTVRVLLMRAARRCQATTRKQLLDLWIRNQAG
jgi:DNA-binding CsgD family transcriptional regulator